MRLGVFVWPHRKGFQTHERNSLALAVFACAQTKETMAYTIRFLDNLSTFAEEQILGTLVCRVRDGGRFTIGSIQQGDEHGYRHFWLSRIRLSVAKAYCGNHPGSCEFPDRKKPRTTYLEWDDWVAFHSLVNEVLDSLSVYADVWTHPQDVRGKFFIRKGMAARTRFDWEESFSHGRPIRVWNKGTDDQFAED